MPARKLSPPPTIGGTDIPEEAAVMAAVRRVVDAGQLGRWRQTVGERQEARAAFLACEKAVELGATPVQLIALLRERAKARAEEELEIRRLFAPNAKIDLGWTNDWTRRREGKGK